ncbi:NAD-dependent epimerase/dehydratase family protein, partial [Pseudokineococcus sp. 1T1Z-3]|uniref:NAD-dependent epimerase/dehydratase family protein n=1 Tax=Pseudokineococcus sp. 1T1Z-3 TaxID=3132745 RepID=UPI0030AF4DB4
GWDVLPVDRAPGPDAPEGLLLVDLTDQAQVVEVVAGRTDEREGRVDAVAHLAAVPAPGVLPNSATFANNMTASWNVQTAARAAGVKQVVWASSETVLGLPFDEPPPYVPVDEHYRARPGSTYSLVKTLEEEMAHHLCRWDPELTMVGLRFSNVMEPRDYAQFPAFDADPMLRKWNLWGYVDARDGAQAVRRGLELRRPGAHVAIVAAADTVMSRSSASLVAEVFPGVEVCGDLGEHETLLGIGTARELLGYDPQHSWRDEATP